jgi:hypothetical protein
MEIRHIILIAIAALAGLAKLWSIRAAIVSRAKSIAGKVGPMPSFAKWMLCISVPVVCLWPDIAGLLPQPKPSPAEVIRTPDIFDNACGSARTLIAEALDEIAGRKFDSDQAAEDYTNEKILDCIEAAFPPVATKIEEARKANKLAQMAARLKAGELRNE